jgi:hypothetical protein
MAWKPDYATASDLAAYVHIVDSDDDAQLALAVTAASRAIDRHTRRQFGRVDSAVARYYTACWSSRLCAWVVPIDDLMTVTGLEVMADLDDSGDYATVIDAYALKPVNAQADGRPWTSLAVLPSSSAQPCGDVDAVEVTAQFGWTAVPTTVKQACLLQASRVFARRGSPFGVAGSPDVGSELRLLAKVDPDVAVMLEDYRKKARPR